MANLPQFRKFDINEEPASLGTRWKSWLAELENLLLAVNITDKKRQRALMLLYAGKDVHDIYKTLIPDPNTDEDFDDAKARISAYMEPKINLTYEIYNFRCMRQGHSADGGIKPDESIDAFVTRLRRKALRCNFPDADKEIKYQVVFGCESMKLRKEALKKDEITLSELLTPGRTYEVIGKQARSMEEDVKVEEVNYLRSSGKYSQRKRIKDAASSGNGQNKDDKKKCFSCGGTFSSCWRAKRVSSEWEEMSQMWCVEPLGVGMQG